ncbi:ML domain-containing protein [Kitasatospora sp. NPDC058492]|uniref:ML domain-containing protein n=1 Tax=unclassified Kitasatospora TaxID=2633591 RepID=UPI0036662A6B
MTTPSTGSVTWNNTGTSSDNFKVSSVSFDPQEPVRGQALTVTPTGTLTGPIASGSVQTVIKFGMVSLVNEASALSAAVVGPYVPPVTFYIPTDAPKGKYTGTLTFTDQKNNEIARITISFSLST